MGNQHSAKVLQLTRRALPEVRNLAPPILWACPPFILRGAHSATSGARGLEEKVGSRDKKLEPSQPSQHPFPPAQ